MALSNLLILIVDDSADDIELFIDELHNLNNNMTYNLNTEIHDVPTMQIAKELLKKNYFDIIFLDLYLPDSKGIDTISNFKEEMERFPTVVLTGLNDTEIAIEVVKQGAQDYLVKTEFNTELLYRTIKYSIERHKTTTDLKRSNNDLKDFAKIVSHDLKSPLNVISGNSELLKMTMGDKLGDENKEMLDNISNTVHWMAGLINDILKYSLISTENSLAETWDLNLVIQELITLYKSSKNISFIIKKKLPQLFCNQVQMLQVFQNLASNSIKYLDKANGVITIDYEDFENNYLFCYEDNSKGIAEANQVELFKLFKKNIVKDHYQSSGVGLPMVQRIIEKYGGKIWVESTLGVGTKFFFTLPKERIVDSKNFNYKLGL